MPRLAALAAALIGAINVASTLTPNIRWRGHLLLEYEPVEAMRLFHALALPAGAALLLVAPYLAKRRRRAFIAAIALMVALGAFDLLKGLDFEETAMTWGAAVALLLASDSFRVRHDAMTLRSTIWRVPLASMVGLTIAGLATWAAEGHPSFGAIVRETGDLLIYSSGPIHFHRAAAWIPLGVHAIEFFTLLLLAYLIFRPLAAPQALPSARARAAAAELVRAHGSDTLSFFKLRADKHYLFSPSGDTLVLIARDAEDVVRGVLHFVPCYGRATVSLSFMRRDSATPNGLMEFMVAQAIELLRERGIAELSLNFAAFAKWLHSPAKRTERALGRLVTLGNPFFQIESLYRFNAKFFPRWEPRYLVYEGAFGLPRAGLAALWAEGQLPKPSLGSPS